MNIDESGFQSFSDATAERVVVSVDYPKEVAKDLANRSISRARLVCEIIGDGSTLKPGIIIQCKTVEAELYQFRYEQEYRKYSQENVFINSAIFQGWMGNVLFPQIEERRKLNPCEVKSIIILDGWPTHFLIIFMISVHIKIFT